MRILALTCLTTALMLASCDSSSNSSATPQSSQPGVVGTWKADTVLTEDGLPTRNLWTKRFDVGGTGTDSMTAIQTSGAVSQTYKMTRTFTWSTTGADVLIQYASCKATQDLSTWDAIDCPEPEKIMNGASASLTSIVVIVDGDILTLKKQ